MIIRYFLQPSHSFWLTKNMFLNTNREKYIFQYITIQDFFVPLCCTSVSYKETDVFIWQINSYKSLIISSFAWSTVDASIEARYICVVAMESCPSASEMTLTGIFFDLAMVAQAWRLTYVVSVTGSFIISVMVLRALLHLLV